MLTNVLGGALWFVALVSGLVVLGVGASNGSANDGGRAMLMMMVSPFFAGSLLLAFTLATARGGMDWLLPASPGLRWCLVLAAVLAAAVVVCLGAALRTEHAGQTPWALWPLRAWAHWVWPSVLVGGAALALWPVWGAGWPPVLWRGPLTVVAAVSLLVAGGLLIQLVQSNVARAEQQVQSDVADENRRDDMIMGQVERADVVNNFADFASLMSQTSRWEKPEIRAKALAKIQAHPKLTEALAQLLRSDWRDQAYAFLADNDAPDPQALLAPLDQALAATPASLQRRLGEVHSLRADEYVHEVKRVLAVLDKFEPQGLDPMPTALALRDALGAPRASKIRLEGSDLVEAWLAARQPKVKRSDGPPRT